MNFTELGDRDELNLRAPKVVDLDLLEPRAGQVDLEHGVLINQFAETQGEVYEPVTGPNEVGDVGVPKRKVVECKTGEPAEGDWVGVGEGHELVPKHGGLQDSVSLVWRVYAKTEPFGLTAADDVLHGAADGAQVRGQHEVEEAEGLDSVTAVAVALALGQQTPCRARERVHSLELRVVAEVADVEEQAREPVGEVPPPRGDCAGADRLAQVKALEDSEEEVVGERADPVLISPDVALVRRRLHGGGDLLVETLARANH